MPRTITSEEYDELDPIDVDAYVKDFTDRFARIPDLSQARSKELLFELRLVLDWIDIDLGDPQIRDGDEYVDVGMDERKTDWAEILQRRIEEFVVHVNSMPTRCEFPSNEHAKRAQAFCADDVILIYASPKIIICMEADNQTHFNHGTHVAFHIYTWAEIEEHFEFAKP